MTPPPKPLPPPPSDGERLKASEYIGYALGDTASNLFFKTFTIFLPVYYVDVWAFQTAHCCG